MDNAAPAVAQVLQRDRSQPFIIENRGGAEGLIGAEACARAAPDGCTLCSTDELVISLNPAIRSKLYNPLRLALSTAQRAGELMGVNCDAQDQIGNS